MAIKWLSSFPIYSALLYSLREYFKSESFIEVITPVRIAAPANELHILPPKSGSKFLHASPELQMKKLLALGMDKIFQICPCFREGENGDRHSEEFQMLEWYRLDAGYMDVLEDMKRFVRKAIHDVLGGSVVSWNGEQIDVDKDWHMITVQDAMIKYAGWDPLKDFDQERFDVDMALKIEPSLPHDRVCVLYDYPAQVASLSKISARDARVAERFEVYMFGMELCNAFSELTDSDEQRKRFVETQNEKLACGEPTMPLDEEFLRVLPNIERASGAAMGVDRLAMLLSGETQISNVRMIEQEI